MTRPPLAHRIAAALVLQPMTASQLRRVLRAGPNTVCSAVSALLVRGEIEPCPRMNLDHGHGRDKPYRLTRKGAEQCQA